MDNEKNIEKTLGKERKDETTSDAANRARNRTVMLTPEVTGQVRALLNQDRQSDIFGKESQKGGDSFSPVNNISSAMTGLITRDGSKEPQPSRGGSSGTGNPSPVEARSAAATGSPINQSVVQAARNNTVGVVTEKLTPIVGFLVSYDSNPAGEVLELRSGRWIVSSERTSDGNFLIVKDASVSPLHAILKISEVGAIQVLDQLSENGTSICHIEGEEEKLSGSMGSIENGDKITFGKRCFHVCLVVKG